MNALDEYIHLVGIVLMVLQGQREMINTYGQHGMSGIFLNFTRENAQLVLDCLDRVEKMLVAGVEKQTEDKLAVSANFTKGLAAARMKNPETRITEELVKKLSSFHSELTSKLATAEDAIKDEIVEKFSALKKEAQEIIDSCGQ